MSGPIGSATSLLVAVGVGGAAAQALEPDFVDIRQQSWKDHPNLVLEPDLLARLVAQGAVDLSAGAEQAEYSGISGDRFDELVWLEQQVPGTAELMYLWRYEKIDEPTWRFGMTKLGYRQDFVDALAGTFVEPLTALEAAVMVQRGVLPNEGQLPVGPPTEVGRVPPMPVVDLSAYGAAKAHGTSKGELDALTRIVGLPASPDLAARMVFRKIIDRIDFDRAIAEGNTRNEWAPFMFEGFRQILTAGQYAELELRGFATADERRANTAKHGLSDDDSNLLYNVLGRAPAISTIVKGLARGGVFDGPIDHIPAVFLATMQRSNIRPEYYSIVYAARFTYPSPFVMRSLAEAGDLGDTKAVETMLEQIGWSPELAARVAAKWVPAGTAADPHVTKAKAQLWATLHGAYVDFDADDAEATADLELVGVDVAAIPDVLALWQAERAIRRRTLSPAQMKKLVGDGRWTVDKATARLVELGYSDADAADLLAE